MEEKIAEVKFGKNHEEFVAVIKFARNIIPAFKMQFNDTGNGWIYAIGMDWAHICLAKFDIDSEDIEFYIKEPFWVVIDTEDLYQVIKNLKKSDELTLTVLRKDEDNSKNYYMVVEIESEDYLKEYELQLGDEINVSSPNLEFQCKVKDISTKEFISALMDIYREEDNVDFTVKDNRGIIIEPHVNDDIRIRIKAEVETENLPVKATYNIDILKHMKNLVKAFPTLNLEFSTDYPANFEFQGNTIMLQYIVAPKVEN